MSQSARIELVKNSLLKTPNAPDKRLYSIIASFTPQEWSEVIKSKSEDTAFYNAIIPFLAYAFKPDLPLEMINNRLVSKLGFGEALADALFFALSNGSLAKEDQPSFDDLCNTPILLNLFNGSVLNAISNTNFSDDVAVFFREKFKLVLENFHNEILINRDSKFTPELALTGNNQLCNINDYDAISVQNAISLIYFLEAIKSAVDMLSIKTLTDESAVLIKTSQFQKIIKDSSVSKKEERIRYKQFECSLAYIMSSIENEASYEVIINQLDPIMLSNIETTFLKSLLASNYNSNEQDDIKEESLLDPVYTDELDENTAHTSGSMFEKIKSSLNSAQRTPHHNHDSCKNAIENEVAIDDVLIKTKRNIAPQIAIIGYFIVAIVGCCLASSYICSKRELQSSVISNAQGGSTISQYPIVKVTTH